jgi:hypothetical protein
MANETITATIEVGQTLTARSIGDHNCIFSIEILARSKSFVTIKDNMFGTIKRCKIKVWNGRESVRPENYSMAPIFYAPEA